MAQKKKTTLPAFVEDENGDFVPQGHPDYSALLDNEAAGALLAWLDAYGGHLQQGGADKTVISIERNAKVITQLARDSARRAIEARAFPPPKLVK